MKNPTLHHAFLVGFASLALICLPAPSLAQHGGGGHAGGGGSHGGGGGSVHGGGGFGGGSYHGGGYGGGYSSHGGYGSSMGGYHGGYGGSMGGGYHGGSGAGRGLGSGRGMGSASRGVSSHPWSSEGQGVRNTSPGWHSFERGSSTASSAHSNPQSNLRSPSNLAGREGGGIQGRSDVASHRAIADGNWHSFNSNTSAHTGGTLLASNAHTSINTGFNHAGFVGTNSVWHGVPLRAGFVGWHGGWGWGWHAGWGWPGWNWGWGVGWGCCGWGWGWGGWGWGWGVGWGLGWGPYWYWPPYAYDPRWSYDNSDGSGY